MPKDDADVDLKAIGAQVETRIRAVRRALREKLGPVEVDGGKQRWVIPMRDEKRAAEAGR